MEPLVWSGSADGILGDTCCLSYALGLQTKPLAREGRSRCLEPKRGHLGGPPHFTSSQIRVSLYCQASLVAMMVVTQFWRRCDLREGKENLIPSGCLSIHACPCPCSVSSGSLAHCAGFIQISIPGSQDLVCV